jgi:glycosyltransferase involved in cell wall biosynthesis
MRVTRGVRRQPHVAERTRRHSLTLVQSTLPAYRQALVDLLRDRLDGGVEVLVGPDDFDPTIRLAANGSPTLVLRNHFLFGRRLLWQSGALAPMLHARVLVADLNPRVLSSWVALLARRALRRPSIIWGHAWPRRGPAARTDLIRHLMRRVATAILVYTETEVSELRRRMPNAIVVAAPNALYPVSAQPEDPAADAHSAVDFVFVGRLVDEKKPRLLLEAFLLALDNLPRETRLVFVGEGPLRRDLEECASSAPGRVVFTGACTDFTQLQAIYGRALASVIPGYAGLSLIQSLWFGVPALIARDDPHSPEIEAARDGINALFFDSDSITSLRDGIASFAAGRADWQRRRADIARECSIRYSLDAMADAFERILELVER